jgi:hypothetical protein
VNCCVVPAAIEGLVGVTAIDTRLAAVPVPLKATVCGLAPPLSEMPRVAFRVPVAVGLKVTVMVQLAVAATELPQLLVCVKSDALVPLTEMLVIFSDVVPLVFVINTVCGAPDVLTGTLPKLKELAERLTTVPLPDRETVCGLELALSLTLRVPLRVPVVVGVKVTLIVHFAPPARLLTHVLLAA